MHLITTYKLKTYTFVQVGLIVCVVTRSVICFLKWKPQYEAHIFLYCQSLSDFASIISLKPDASSVLEIYNYIPHIFLCKPEFFCLCIKSNKSTKVLVDRRCQLQGLIRRMYLRLCVLNKFPSTWSNNAHVGSSNNKYKHKERGTESWGEENIGRKNANLTFY